MSKRGMRIVLRIVLGCLAAGLLLEAVLLFCVVREETRLREVKPADVILVLGARVMPDGEMSTTLENRVISAYRAYEEGLAPAFIVCGAQGANEPKSEAAAMREALLARGVDEEDILLEDASYSTRENLLNARAIMEEKGYKTAIVVSTDYHLARVLALCRDVGIEATGIASAAPETPLVHWKGRVRETISWVFYFLRYRLFA